MKPLFPAPTPPRRPALRAGRATATAGALVLAGASLSSLAWGQPRPAAPTPPGAPAAGPPAPVEGQEGPKVRVEKGAGGKTVYRITEAIRIEGKIQKPEAFYVLQKSSINYDWQDLKQDFVPKIVDSVSKAPF